MAKDAKGHGSEKSGVGAMPIPGHPYHMKSDAELHYIAKDAHEAAQAMQGHSPASENKYLDQVNDASTVLGYRARGGSIVQPPPAAHQTGVHEASLVGSMPRGGFASSNPRDVRSHREMSALRGK